MAGRGVVRVRSPLCWGRWVQRGVTESGEAWPYLQGKICGGHAKLQVSKPAARSLGPRGQVPRGPFVPRRRAQAPAAGRAGLCLRERAGLTGLVLFSGMTSESLALSGLRV